MEIANVLSNNNFDTAATITVLTTKAQPEATPQPDAPLVPSYPVHEADNMTWPSIDYPMYCEKQMRDKFPLVSRTAIRHIMRMECCDTVRTEKAIRLWLLDGAKFDSLAHGLTEETVRDSELKKMEKLKLPPQLLTTEQSIILLRHMRRLCGYISTNVSSVLAALIEKSFEATDKEVDESLAVSALDISMVSVNNSNLEFPLLNHPYS